MANYWEAVMTSRIARRRALAASGAAVASMAALSVAGCGGGSKSAPASKAGGLVAVPADSTSLVKPGGVLKDFLTGDAAHFDALISDRSDVVNTVSVYAYPRLLRFTL